MTNPSRRRIVWLLARLTAYLGVVVLLFQARTSVDWRHLFTRAPTEGAVPNTLRLAGVDLAPGLLGPQIDRYARDYPRVRIEREPGGTHRALELLINRQCDTAFTLRPLTPGEQALALEATGDTIQVTTVALGGLVLIRAVDAGNDVIELEALRMLSLAGPVAGVDRLYVPDPNSGLWAAFLARLAPAVADSARGAAVIFLSDEMAVLEAVRRDPAAIGLASSLSLPENLGAAGVRSLAVARERAGAPIPPTYENIGAGRYPLFHYLHAAGRPGGGLEGAMFITHLSSLRGQRRIERAGFLPARQSLRPVVLSTDPIGDSR